MTVLSTHSPFSRCVALACCVIFATAVEAVRAEPINLLSNPGGESGSTTPWQINTIFGAETTLSVTSGTISIAGQTLKATEGSYWFSADGTESSINAGFGGFIKAYQTVDVSGLGATAVQFQSDAFAAGEIVSGEGTILLSHMIILGFSDSSYNNISFYFWSSGLNDVTNDKVMFTGTPVVATLPAGTTRIDFWNQINLQPYSGTNLTYRVVAGLDNASLQVAPVPEPATYAMALAGIACGGYSVFRRRKRA